MLTCYLMPPLMLMLYTRHYAMMPHERCRHIVFAASDATPDAILMLHAPPVMIFAITIRYAVALLRYDADYAMMLALRG